MTPDGTGLILPDHILRDPYGRRLTYLRISVTDRCNLRCSYCMPSDGVAKLTHSEVLSLEELARVARVAVGMGVDKIRLTGGEPLLRRDLEVLLARLSALEPRPDLRITTNGVYLAEHLDLLVANHVSTVNVSLDSLDPDKYGAVTGLGPLRGPKVFARVWSALMAALERDDITVKLNVVLLRDVNLEEVAAFARLTQDLPLAVRFIEYMPVGRKKEPQPERFLSCPEAEERITQELGPLEPLAHRAGDGPARRALLPGAAGELGFISALSSHFCATCNRLRLSAEGRLVPCLFSELSVDLRGVLRNGAGDEAVAATLLEAARLKPRRHNMHAGEKNGHGAAMSRLGG